MKVLRHFFAGIVLMSILIVLVVTAYNGVVTNYDVTVTDTKVSNVTGLNVTIAERFQEMNMIEGISNISANVQSLSSAGGDLQDIAGAIVGVGTGTVKVLFGTLVMPYEFGSIITTYYTG